MHLATRRGLLDPPGGAIVDRLGTASAVRAAALRWGCNSGPEREPAYKAIVGAGRQPSVFSGIAIVSSPSTSLRVCHARASGGWLLLTRGRLLVLGGCLGGRGSASCAPAGCALQGKAGAGVHHRRAPGVHGGDDLLRGDPLQIRASRGEVRMLDMRVIWELWPRSRGGPGRPGFSAGCSYAVGAKRRSA